MINAQDCVPLTEHAQSWLHGQAGASLNACSCSLLMKKELFCVGVLPEHGMTSCSIAILLCRAGSLVGRSGQSLPCCVSLCRSRTSGAHKQPVWLAAVIWLQLPML